MRMKKFFRTNIFKIVLMIALAGTVLVSYSTSVKTSVVVSAMGYITQPIQNFLASKNTNTSQVQSTGGEEQIYELRNKLVDYYEMKSENEEMKRILGLKEEHQDYKLVQADVIGRDSAELYYGATLNKGSNSGVSLYSPVITDKGVVGYISAIYATHSKVSTILSPQTNIGAYDTVSNDTAVVSGSTDDIATNKVSLKYINTQNNIAKGDMIVTSGVGEVYPKNLLIGEVSEISVSSNGYDIKAEIEPYENIKEIRKVYIITDFSGKNAKAIRG